LHHTGITLAAEAQAIIDARAALAQIYTGLIYRGPGLVKEILEAFASQLG